MTEGFSVLLAFSAIFCPESIPLPLTNVDTYLKFRGMGSLQDNAANELWFELLFLTNYEGVRDWLTLS